ncbi:MAG: MBL fold metallo-hydrolase [Myxococcaceae bacterium]|jgi:L-ascorbate metabolism protein UlaG (beta-lactamase superfamily)|nr:MBL fold metallo-hydrolase [Myxococcaceae bacterium]
MRRWRWLLAGLVAVPLVVVAVFFVGVRHVPFMIPAEDQGPASLRVPVDGGVSLRFLGVSGYEVTDGVTVVLLDPTPTRPPPSALLTGPLEPDEALGARECPKADVILVNHTHFDHALDVPAIARRTGALVVGSQSTVNLARSRGVPAEKTRVVHAGDRFTVGTFSIEVGRSRHTAIAGIDQPMSGVVPEDAGPLWFWQFTLDETLFYRLEAAGTSVWFHPTSTWADGEIVGAPAPTLIVGVTGEDQTVAKARGLLGATKARLVLPTHYDNFFQPWDKGLAKMPGLDLGKARAAFEAVDAGITWAVLDQGERIWLPRD